MSRPRAIDDARILDAARSVFITRGAQADTRLVAEAADVSQALLFQRYGTKTGLFFAAMIPRPPDLDSLIGPMPKCRSSVRDSFLGVAERLLGWLDTAMPGALRAALHPDFHNALGAAHSADGADSIRKGLSGWLNALQKAGLIEPSLDPDATVQGFIELLHGQALIAMLAPGEPAHRRAERCLSLIWTSITR